MSTAQALTKQMVDDLMVAMSKVPQTEWVVIKGPVIDIPLHQLAARAYRASVRRYVWEGGVYILRDYYTKYGFFAGCGYAVRNRNGSKRWVRCAEGVDFCDIEPYRSRHYGLEDRRAA